MEGLTELENAAVGAASAGCVAVTLQPTLYWKNAAAQASRSHPSPRQCGSLAPNSAPSPAAGPALHPAAVPALSRLRRQPAQGDVGDGAAVRRRRADEGGRRRLVLGRPRDCGRRRGRRGRCSACDAVRVCHGAAAAARHLAAADASRHRAAARCARRPLPWAGPRRAARLDLRRLHARTHSRGAQSRRDAPAH